VRVSEERDPEISEESGRKREATSSHLSKHACIYFLWSARRCGRKKDLGMEGMKDAIDFTSYAAGTKSR